jgi:hypothetical protein
MAGCVRAEPARGRQRPQERPDMADVDLALVGPMLSDVAHPKKIRAIDGETALYEVLRGLGQRVLDGAALGTAAVDALDTVSTHEPGDAVVPDRHPVALNQLLVDPRRAVGPVGRFMDQPHPLNQGGICPGPRRRLSRALAPGIQGASRDAQGAAQDGNLVVGLLRFHQVIAHLDRKLISPAKKAAAFPRISFFHLQHPVLPAQLHEFCLLLGRETFGAALVDICLVHPVAQAALGNPEIGSDLGDRLGSLPGELHGSSVELRRMWTRHADSSPRGR